MLQTLAELLNVTNEELKKLGVLNVYLNYDSGYSVEWNPMRLWDSQEREADHSLGISSG